RRGDARARDRGRASAARARQRRRAARGADGEGAARGLGGDLALGRGREPRGVAVRAARVRESRRERRLVDDARAALARLGLEPVRRVEAGYTETERWIV